MNYQEQKQIHIKKGTTGRAIYKSLPAKFKKRSVLLFSWSLKKNNGNSELSFYVNPTLTFSFFSPGACSSSRTRWLPDGCPNSISLYEPGNNIPASLRRPPIKFSYI
jgi:hypothetical protein